MVMVVAIAACAPQASPEAEIGLVDLPIRVTFDDKLASAEKHEVKSALEWLRDFPLADYHKDKYLSPDDVEFSPWFEKIFGGSDSASVLRFIDERIDYLVDGSYDFAKRGMADPLALNFGAELFLAHLYRGGRVPWLKIGDERVYVKDSRVGIVELYDSFFAMGEDQESRYFHQVLTLVHESRHSDCPGGLTKVELTKFVEQDAWTNFQCTHPHVKCPLGHRGAGRQRCDQGGWGAHAVAAVFADRVAHCANCSSQLVQNAMRASTSSARMILDRQKLFSGKMGAPRLDHDPVMRGEGL